MTGKGIFIVFRQDAESKSCAVLSLILLYLGHDLHSQATVGRHPSRTEHNSPLMLSSDLYTKGQAKPVAPSLMPIDD